MHCDSNILFDLIFVFWPALGTWAIIILAERLRHIAIWVNVAAVSRGSHLGHPIGKETAIKESGCLVAKSSPLISWVTTARLTGSVSDRPCKYKLMPIAKPYASANSLF